MTLLTLIIVSSLVLTILVIARIYESKKGRNIWHTVGLSGTLNWLEKKFSNIADNVAHFDSKNIAEYIKNTWHILTVFYHALQRLATEKITENRAVPPSNGNKAASFYLKSIKEHKEKTHLEESDIEGKLE